MTNNSPVAVPSSTVQKLKELWVSEDAFATTLAASFIDRYTVEAMAWSPLTITLELNDDLGVTVPPANRDRLQAALYHISTDDFFNSVPTFNELCLIFSGHHWSPETVEIASADDVAWGITEALLLAPPDPELDDPFSEEIVAFIGQVVANEGILNPPDALKLAGVNKKLIDQIRYDYSDDPAMFEGIWQAERSKTDEINALVRGRLKMLVRQLEELPLQNGDTKKIAGRMSKQLEQLKKN